MDFAPAYARMIENGRKAVSRLQMVGVRVFPHLTASSVLVLAVGFPSFGWKSRSVTFPSRRIAVEEKAAGGVQLNMK
jgi:hypothetical protein